MSPDLIVAVIASLGWLVLCGAVLASYRLQWGQMFRLALVWFAIFAGLYMLVEWFILARATSGAVL
ncbi:hypothetical protein [Erythrobacter tepidarius]|uniref:hypothetical protein n=1 Tax=Erythrobacter tepidarius TaxID=60454 RepID=UPI000A395095|nr:hypothetical protein [Erythrobacter tepidarius]